MHVFSFVPSWHRRYEHRDRLEVSSEKLRITSFCSIYTWYIRGYSTFQHPGTLHRDNKPCDCSSETSSWERQAPLALHLGVLLAVLPTTSPRQCSIESCSIHVALNIFHLSDCHRIPLEKNMFGPSSCDLLTCARCFGRWPRGTPCPGARLLQRSLQKTDAPEAPGLQVLEVLVESFFGNP